MGANVAVLFAATYVTVPGTGAPPTPATANENVPAAVTLALFIASLNVAVSLRLSATFTAPFTGLVNSTVGIVPVVKFQTKSLPKECHSRP